MTRAEVIASLEDQARDKDSLAGEEPDGIFARDAEALRQAVWMLRGRERTCAYCGIFERHSGYLAEYPEHAMRYCWHCGRKLREEETMEIKTYPKMNETIKDLLRRSEEPMNLYILARIEDLEKQVKDLTPPPNVPLTLEELREMGGEPYWHIGLRDDSPPPHWAILPSYVAQRPQDYFYGKHWLAYRRRQEEEYC